MLAVSIVTSTLLSLRFAWSRAIVPFTFLNSPRTGVKKRRRLNPTRVWLESRLSVSVAAGAAPAPRARARTAAANVADNLRSVGRIDRCLLGEGGAGAGCRERTAVGCRHRA